jgi:hemoglobin
MEGAMQRNPALPLVAAAAAIAIVAACTTAPPKPVAKLNDGELAIPADYKSWPKFLTAVERPDAKQVRDIYVIPGADRTKAGDPFPDGTVFVMENYAAKANADGTLVTGGDGKLVKRDLLRVFVMGKGEGFADKTIPELKNGTWVYAAYDAAGKPAPDPTANCRACHLPQASKDFVHRYDEYFSSRPVIRSGY